MMAWSRVELKPLKQHKNKYPYAFFVADYLWVDWVWRKRAVPRDVLQPGQQQKVLESRQQVHCYWPPASTISNQLHNGWRPARPKDGCNGEWRLHHKYVSKFTLGVTKVSILRPMPFQFSSFKGRPTFAAWLYRHVSLAIWSECWYKGPDLQREKRRFGNWFPLWLSFDR